jgi:hypothetical protein
MPPPATSISTPLPTGATLNRGRFITTINGEIEVTILPDTTTTNPNISGGRTSYNWSLGRFSPPRIDRGTGLVTSFTLPSVKVTIQTVYRIRVNQAGTSAYGRGTTAVDQAAGNTTLRFHEGSHGTSALNYFRNHPLPTFTGAVGMTVIAFQAAMTQYQADVRTYFEQQVINNEREVDCVGTPATGILESGSTCSTLTTPNP